MEPRQSLSMVFWKLTNFGCFPLDAIFVKHAYVCHAVFQSSEYLHMRMEVYRCSLQLLMCVVWIDFCFGTCVMASNRSRDHFWPNATTVLWPFFRDHPGEPVPKENFWTLWCKGR